MAVRLTLLTLLLAAQALAQELPLWPGKVPDAVPVAKPENETLVADNLVAGKPWTYIGKVSHPTLTVYPAKNPNGTCLVVFPGGGYWILAIDLEGTEVADWFTQRGVTCVVVKYRVPGEDLSPRSGCFPRSKMALQDAQRAMGLVRYHAAEWKIDPKKIGVLGFSAGGHLVAAISTHWEKRLYPPVDAADKVSCRPDFGVALYPGHLTEFTDQGLNPYVPVSRKTPPTFLVHAKDDPVDPVENTYVYCRALKEKGVPVEMHVFPTGGHAFGLRPTKEPITRWPELLEKWLGRLGMLE